jgi:hypothetical protein
MSLVLQWTVQVQVMLQIIINRVRVISTSNRYSRHLIIGTAIIVGLINISVFCIWIPARLQISERSASSEFMLEKHTLLSTSANRTRYIEINNVWDRIEKVIYLFLDVALNAYFIQQVRRNLTQNGLDKYNKLLTYNVRIIFISLLMDIMIIAAMSIPNTFVYVSRAPSTMQHV